MFQQQSVMRHCVQCFLAWRVQGIYGDPRNGLDKPRLLAEEPQ